MRAAAFLMSLNPSDQAGDLKTTSWAEQLTPEQRDQYVKSPKLFLGEIIEVDGQRCAGLPVEAVLKLVGVKPRVLDTELAEQIAVALEAHNISSLIVIDDLPAARKWLKNETGKMICSALTSF